MEKEKVTLKKAVELFCGNEMEFAVFKNYLKKALDITENNDTILEEGEVVEIQFGIVTISFTWDMISAVNNITNEYVDLTTPERAIRVFY